MRLMQEGAHSLARDSLALGDELVFPSVLSTSDMLAVHRGDGSAPAQLKQNNLTIHYINFSVKICFWPMD